MSENTSAFIRQVLAEEELYGNGPPSWREGINQRPCQTAAQAEHERQKTIKRLLRFGSGNKAAKALANLLSTCARYDRCYSAACPACGRAFQRWAVEATHDFLVGEHNFPIRGSTALSLIHCSGATAPGKLQLEGFRAVKRYYRTALTSAPVRAAVCNIDTSFNEDLEGSFESHWSLRLHGHAPGELSEVAEIGLRKLFPRCTCNAITRPVQVVPFDGNLAGLAYAHKPSAGRRQGYLQTKTTAEGERTCRNTRSRPLLGVQAVEVALLLDSIGLRGRLLLHGTKLVRRSDGSVVIRRK